MVISAGDSHGSLGWDRERQGCPCPPTAPPVLPEHGEREPRASSGCPPRAVPLNAHTSQCCALSDPAPPAPAGRREGVEICIRERTRPCRGHCHPSPSPGVPPPPRGDISPACSCPPWGSHPRELLPLPHATLSPPSAHNLPVGVGGPCPPPALTPTGPRQPSGATGGRGGGGAAGPRSSPASPRVPRAPGRAEPPTRRRPPRSHDAQLVRLRQPVLGLVLVEELEQGADVQLVVHVHRLTARVLDFGHRHRLAHCREGGTRSDRGAALSSSGPRAGLCLPKPPRASSSSFSSSSPRPQTRRRCSPTVVMGRA